MDIEHTAGPWCAVQNHRTPDWRVEYEVGGERYTLTTGHNEVTARLIAAAPELRSTGTAMAETALKLIEAICDDGDWHDIADRLNDQVYAFRYTALLKGGSK